MKIVIFDIDGTLANIDHRLHHVKDKPKNWPAFDKAIPDDEPVLPVVEVLKSLYRTPYPIMLCSGRSEQTRGRTVDWLDKHNIIDYVFQLRMREDGDYRADDIIKSEMLDGILADGYNPMMVFDDRPRVVNMWRDRGYYVFDCNQSGKDF